MNKLIFICLLTLSGLLHAQNEYRFVIKSDKVSDYSRTIATVRANAFTVFSPYQDSIAFEMADLTGIKQPLKIKLFYFGDSCYLIGEHAKFDTTFSTLHNWVRFEKRLKKKINIDMKVDNLYPFTVVVEFLSNDTLQYSKYLYLGVKSRLATKVR